MDTIYLLVGLIVMVGFLLIGAPFFVAFIGGGLFLLLGFAHLPPAAMVQLAWNSVYKFR